jgi:spore germination cell wall hydrolase CwlJ-like protein
LPSNLATRVKTRASIILLILAWDAGGSTFAHAQGPVAPARPGVLTRSVDCLAAAVYYEARGEPPDGQAAVAQVVINRAHRPGYPKDLCAVIYQGAAEGRCQFSFVCGGAMAAPRQPAPWRRAQAVAARALSGYVMRGVGEATSFHAVRLGHGCDGHLTRLAQLGGHVFLGVGGPAGAPLNLIAQRSPAASTPAARSPLMRGSGAS